MSEADKPSSDTSIEAEEADSSISSTSSDTSIESGKAEEKDEPEDTGEPGQSQAVANKLSSTSGCLKSLPTEVKRRIQALKKLQTESINIEAEFYKEVNALELKYAPKFSNNFEKRKDILNAKREPTNEECDWPSVEEDDDKDKEAKLAGELNDTSAMEEKKEAGVDTEKKHEEVKGIPSFWLTVLKNVDMLSDMIQGHDEPILAHLQDIQVKIHDKAPVGFSLEFHFEPNEYFTDTVLTKCYEMRYEPDPDDLLSYEGPKIVKCTGCTINWNKGKNVTVKQIKKKQKHKGRGVTKTEQVQTDSFFNFFNPPAVPEESVSKVDCLISTGVNRMSNPKQISWVQDEKMKGADFKIGHYIKERIVPRAVLYFTREALEHDDKTGAPVSSTESLKSKSSITPSSSDSPLSTGEELKLSSQCPANTGSSPANMSRHEGPWRIYIQNLPKKLSERDVKWLFEQYGTILACHVKYITDLAYAFIDFENKEDAHACIHGENGRQICGENILVDWLRDQDKMMYSKGSSQNIYKCLPTCCNMRRNTGYLSEQRWRRLCGVTSTSCSRAKRRISRRPKVIYVCSSKRTTSRNKQRSHSRSNRSRKKERKRVKSGSGSHRSKSGSIDKKKGKHYKNDSRDRKSSGSRSKSSERKRSKSGSGSHRSRSKSIDKKQGKRYKNDSRDRKSSSSCSKSRSGSVDKKKGRHHKNDSRDRKSSGSLSKPRVPPSTGCSPGKGMKSVDITVTINSPSKTKSRSKTPRQPLDNTSDEDAGDIFKEHNDSGEDAGDRFKEDNDNERDDGNDCTESGSNV